MLSTEGVYNEIIEAIEKGSPYSLVRIGDGETVCLNSFNDRERLNKVMLNHLGYIPSNDDIDDIRQFLIVAIEQSNTIGVPPERYLRSKNKYWSQGLQIVKSNTNLSNSTKYCSMNIHRDFMVDNWYDKILSNVDNLYYISCHNFDEEIKKRFNLKEVKSFQISPEMKYFPNYQGDKHYPEIFDKVRGWINNQDMRGKVTLVAGGIVGKIYCFWIKQAGGIAIDIGSVADWWSGHCTRGKGKGTLDSTYKL